MSLADLQKATILIVDDNPTNLRLLSDAIANSGWEILVSTDGESAIEQAIYTQPDLILLDIMMPPGIDGFETCRQLKKNDSTANIPIIFMTALSETMDKVQGFSLGGVDYITKPFQTQEVLARIKTHLQLSNLHKALDNQRADLEQQVQERTKQLTQAVQNLQQSQLQLIQSEKMSMLGQLVAGVAHEINNPVGFIAGNVSYALEYINDLIQHLKLYQQNFPAPGDEIETHAEEIDLDYLFEDLPKLVSSMKLGTERICNISLSLRNFSRVDSSNGNSYNLHEGIESTLLILRHRLKGNAHHPEIEIIKQYGEIPLIECYGGQLNQVLMNLLSNAIDACEESNQGRSYQEIEASPNQITISTVLDSDGQQVKISIKDNGSGMSSEVKKKVFDHLFTTKPMGTGTGLGLSISRQIIEEKHQGSLECFSNLGEGAEFNFTIPIKISIA